MADDLDGIVEDTVDVDVSEDQDFDNLEDAVEALEDDNEDDEQPDTDEDAAEADEQDESDEDAEPENEDSADEAIVELPDGQTLTLSEIADLQANGLRDKDYRHKTTEVATQRKALETEREAHKADAHKLKTTVDNLTAYLGTLIPPEPDIHLAQTNPNAYTQQKALREQSLAELQQVMTVKEQMNQQVQGISEADMTRLRADEAEKLTAAMPHLADPVKRAAFDASVKEAALEFGFSEEQIASTVDHKILQLVHYAKLGKQADTNRANAKRRVEAPKKIKPTRSQIAPRAMAQRKAMDRLTKSGSPDDAMLIDFD